MNYFDSLGEIRIINLFLVGAGISVAGLQFQRYTNNFLADSYLLGVAPASILVFLILKLFLSASLDPNIQVFISILVSTIICLPIFLFRSFSKAQLIFYGISFGSLCLTISSILIYMYPDHFSNGYQKLLGLSMFDNNVLITQVLVLGLIIISIILIDILLYKKNILFSMFSSRFLNLSDHTFISLISLTIATFLTSLITIEFGVVSFIGFIVPNFLRISFGNSFKFLTTCCVILGGFIMLMSDWFGRILYPPYGLPASIITSIIGIPFFLIIMRKSNNRL